MKHLTTQEVLTRYGVTRSTLYRWQHSAEVGFPHPMKIGHRTLWRDEDLRAFDTKQISVA